MLRLLFVERTAEDAAATVGQLRRSGMEVDYRAVCDEESLAAAMRQRGWAAVIAEDQLNGWTGLDALSVVRQHDVDMPFILYSATIADERAAQAIRGGANDYVTKDGVTRLARSLEREIRDVATRVERRHFFEQLRQTQLRYRRTFEQAPIGIANANASGVLISVNERLCAILGYSAHEVVGRHFSEFSHPDDIALAEENLRAIVAGEKNTTSFDRRYIHKDGRVVWVSVTLTPVVDLDGNLAHIIGLIEDITGQREALEQVAVQARLLDSVEQAVLAFDLDGNVLYANRFAESLYGWTAAEARGRHVLDIYQPAADIAFDEMLTTLRQGESWSREVTLTHRDGTPFSASIVHTPLTGARGISGVVSVSTDITERIRAAEDLLRHKEQLAEAQDLAKMGSWEYDMASGSRIWSDQMARIYGLPPGQQLPEGGAIAMAHPDDRDRLRAIHERAVASLLPFETDHRIVLPDGTIKALYVRSRFVTSPDGRVKSIGISQDITETKHIQEELRRRTVQQSAVANLGQIALSGAPLRALFEHAAAAASEVLDLDLCEIIRGKQGEKFVRVAGTGWDAAELDRPFGDETSHAAFVMERGTPVIVDDVSRETRFTTPPCVLSHAAVSAALVPIASGSEAWGILGVYAPHPRSFTSNEVDFLRAVATVLGQAIERTRAEVELRVRAAQQSAIAELGRIATKRVDRETLERACDLLRSGLSIDYAFICEVNGSYQPKSCWGDCNDAPALRDHVALCAKNGEPQLIVAGSEGAPNGICVPVATPERVLGVLAAFTRKRHHFTPADVQFAQSLANTIAETSERQRVRREMEESEERYRSVVEGASEIIFGISADGRFTSLNRAFETITGWTCAEWIGRPFIDLIAPDSRGDVQELFGQVLIEGTP
ncbi:MAG TPA: PAS domain S-box protein, partial [Thermoanaerobaculia bacterium]|nr:PAS domain S-box protein [Thermoanaerobaculia bacterium]